MRPPPASPYDGPLSPYDGRLASPYIGRSSLTLMGIRTATPYRSELAALDAQAWPGYLSARSGLPGPRANLELVAAVADVGTEPVFDALIGSGDERAEEYLVVCGVVGLGGVLGASPRREDVVDRLHALAGDERWRVREAVAMALQRLGDADLPRLLALASVWGRDGNPLVQRAAIAGLCEPRLLRAPDAALAAVDLCEIVTAALAARPAAQRRRPDVRTLRQGLGYCWSVAVAADPADGLPRFLALAASAARPGADTDVAWVVRENQRKHRLVRLLPG